MFELLRYARRWCGACVVNAGLRVMGIAPARVVTFTNPGWSDEELGAWAARVCVRVGAPPGTVVNVPRAARPTFLVVRELAGR